MAVAQYGLSWDSHRSHVCDGFVNLQQNEEFVDMTLAADGHLVNVHKNVFALASPYIKAMLRSTPNQHPVIFLSNVSHDILNYIITYVYTGEVFVDVDKMVLFMKAAKELCLRGLGDINVPKMNIGENRRNNINTTRQANSEIPNVLIPAHEITTQANTNVQINTTAVQNIGVDNSINNVETEQYCVLNEVSPMELTYDTTMGNPEIRANTNNSESGLYMTADGYEYQLELHNVCNNTESILKTNETCTDNCKHVNQENNCMEADATAPMPIITTDLSNVTSSNKGLLKPKDFTPQFTISNRGSLQLILNRYMYYCHHQSHGGRKRRWRCIDYRKCHCPAFIDTDCEVMTLRKFVHSHSFHDDKIMKKLKEKKFFTSLNTVIQKLTNEKKEKIDER